MLNLMARRIVRLAASQPPRLNQGRMQIQVVRHHRRADDADRHNDHPCFAEPWREQRLAHLQEAGLRLRQDEDLDEVAAADGRDQDER